MLHTAQFPYPGSTAMLDGAPVRIHQQIDADTVLVMGDKVTRRASLDDLTPPPAKSLLEQWIEQFVVSAAAQDVFTPATEAIDHFRAWLERTGHAEAAPLSDFLFLKMMGEAGHKRTHGLWRAPGDRQARTHVLFRFALRSL
jgi:hypothetical protein